MFLVSTNENTTYILKLKHLACGLDNNNNKTAPKLDRYFQGLDTEILITMIGTYSEPGFEDRGHLATNTKSNSFYEFSPRRSTTSYSVFGISGSSR